MAHHSDEAAVIIEALSGPGIDNEPQTRAERFALGQLRLLKIVIAQNDAVIAHIEETNKRLKHLFEQGQHVEHATRNLTAAIEGLRR